MTPPLTALVEALREMIDTQSSWEASIEKIIGRQPNIFQRAIDRGRAALSAFEAEPQGWRTMDSAPKDGTEILAIVPVTRSFGDSDATPEFDQRIVWWEARGQWTDDRDLGPVAFTHWQPLPLPPEMKE